ncbi:gamma-glutamylcyclotransferase [Pseudonocardia sp. HH130630-07]|uniref:gamma-glutamylcyclotransferase n=1 Tax=Pseudonocardia sp. HH130630-07 TaxID=1690815 RepID=UPI000814DCB9|nr:gamma-glutamylcyclotransferase [Pseudonocardia sp. HH130630-07]ANY06242.1 hypothetical protein AFB00_07945 [Pseudonocardia sp. HH130630-07]
MRPDTAGGRPDSEFPADPYPGARVGASYVHLGGYSYPLVADPARPSGLRVAGRCLDAWLAGHGAVPCAGRVPVLAYGSNANPSKISWMRAERGLTGPVVVLRVRCDGLSAVWSAGTRVVDDQRPATLAAAPGTVEEHAVWLAAPDQFAALDAVEGRSADPPRYRLARVATGTVSLLDGGGRLDRPWAYVAPATPSGAPRTDRRPLLLDGVPVPCTAVDQAGAAALDGVPGPDGLDVTTVDGVPTPDGWPSRVFVYGTLMPGEHAWPLLREHAAAVLPQPSFLPVGGLADTGLGRPALSPDTGAGVPGFTVELADPCGALPELDRYAGPGHQRARFTLDDGTVCWSWRWTGQRDGHTALPGGWAARRRG